MDHHSIPEKSLTWSCYIIGEDKDRLKPLIFVLIFGVYIYVLNWFVLFVSGEIQFGFVSILCLSLRMACKAFCLFQRSKIVPIKYRLFVKTVLVGLIHKTI